MQHLARITAACVVAGLVAGWVGTKLNINLLVSAGGMILMVGLVLSWGIILYLFFGRHRQSPTHHHDH